MRQFIDGTECRFLRQVVIDRVIEPKTERTITDEIGGVILLVGDGRANDGVTCVENEDIFIECGAEISSVIFDGTFFINHIKAKILCRNGD